MYIRLPGNLWTKGNIRKTAKKQMAGVSIMK